MPSISRNKTGATDLPVFMMPCSLFAPQYIIMPGPTFVSLPSTFISPVPSVMSMNSSSGCLWGGCGSAPGSVANCLPSSTSTVPSDRHNKSAGRRKAPSSTWPLSSSIVPSGNFGAAAPGIDKSHGAKK